MNFKIYILLALFLLTSCVNTPNSNSGDTKATKIAKVFEPKNNAFSVNYPFQVETKIEQRQSNGFLAVDFFEASNELPSYAITTYSVEWTSMEGETEASFLKKWKEFVPTYFANNFGNKAKIELVELRPYIHSNSYRGYEYVGQGVLRNGKTFGNINAVTFKSENAICTIYQISVIPNGASRPVFDSEEFQYQHFQRFISTFNVNEEST